MSAPAPWSPMMAPPLPCRNDLETDTCEHAYPLDSCRGLWHLPDPLEVKLRAEYAKLFAGIVPPVGLIRIGSII